ncbi:two-component system sporulation sensor kinase B [Paenibacillus taihuensis]|uniref:histidine kinase n=1 Tax=Paenibacillus taihuensis TaxID=1156355 RepID=A0A3D9R1V5_9BACL|nr:HAMP domain-containing sensor histidine kinase [Paenibacillus taihuensis]REE68123.1 two-component system sporulation sensor kinase B [Paenibacillus taihuensis]
MNLTKDFLLQLSLVGFPLGIYLAYVLGHIGPVTHIKLFITLLWGSSIALCMSFPIYYGTGSHIDLRIVPLLMGTLYAGRRAGFCLAMFILVYRFIEAGAVPGFWTTALALLLGFSVVLYAQRMFEQAAKGKRLRIALLLAAFYCVLGSVLVGVLQGVTAESLLVQFILLNVVVGIVATMIGLIETMAEIHTMRKELHNAERLRLIGDLTGVFAHEIRNPMQVVRGFLQLLDSPELPAASKTQYIRLSIEELDRTNEIISEFLLLGKPVTDNLEKFDVGKQLQRTVNLINNYALDKNVMIETTIEPDCFVNGNMQRLNQFMINIMKNAIEAMPNGGTVQASCIVVDKSHIEIHVKDEGVGMSKSEVERLGSPYYSLKKNGTGLGMMISFQIIRTFGGTLQVYSEQKVGTEVIARIPCVKYSPSLESSSLQSG